MRMEQLLDSCDSVEATTQPMWTHAGTLVLGQDEDDDEFDDFGDHDDDADEEFDEFGDDDDDLDDDLDEDDEDL